MASDRERGEALRREANRRVRALPRAVRETQAEVRRILRLAERRIRREMRLGTADIDRARLPILLEGIREALEEADAEAAAAAAEGAETAWSAGVDTVAKPIEAGARLEEPEWRIEALFHAPDRRQIEAIKTFLTTKMRDISTATADRLNTRLGLVVAGAIDPNTATNHMQRILGGNRARALTVVRTEVGRAFAAASQAELSAAAERIPGLGKRWSHSGKSKDPRRYHIAANGQIRAANANYDIPDPKTGATVAMLHPVDPSAPPRQTINCGCASVPYSPQWAQPPSPTRY